MLLRNHPAPGSNSARSGLDAAIVASVLAMGALNLLVLAGQIGPAKAHAAVPCKCVPAGIALA